MSSKKIVSYATDDHNVLYDGLGRPCVALRLVAMMMVYKESQVEEIVVVFFDEAILILMVRLIFHHQLLPVGLIQCPSLSSFFPPRKVRLDT